MKRLLLNKLLILCFLFPAHLFAQGSGEEIDITGLWKGTLYNDTTKQYLNYEIAISESNGKLTGYSYTLFEIDGKKEMGVKKIKIKRAGEQLTIEDVELIFNNYSIPPPKKVRMMSIANLLVKDTAKIITGKWSTNRTKEYRQLTGSLQVQRSVDYRPLVLFKKLKELDLAQDLSFVKLDQKRQEDIALQQQQTAVHVVTPAGKIVEKEGSTSAGQPVAIVAVKDTSKIINSTGPTAAVKAPETKTPSDLAITGKKQSGTQPAFDKEATAVLIPSVTKKQEPVIPKQEVTKKQEAVIPKQEMTKKQEPVVATKQEVAKKEVPVAKETVKIPAQAEATSGQSIVKNADAPVSKPPVEKVVVSSNVATAPVIKSETLVSLPATKLTVAAANVLERKMNTTQSVFFESDSLVLTLYDNGDVDGDTVSVLMNGQIIFAKQALSTRANSKTIYVDQSVSDSISMVMYAENLGSIPPNTGLMVIMDGEKRYEVRFSADLKTNAAILLRRRVKDK